MSVGGLRDIFGTEWMGRYEEGTPAEDCTGLLAEAALEYPDDLLRAYVTSKPEGLFIEEDGSFR